MLHFCIYFQVVFVGMMFGSSFWGWLADNYGRKFVSFLNTVEPLLGGYSWGRDNWPLYRGGRLIEVHQKTMLGVVQFSVYQI